MTTKPLPLDAFSCALAGINLIEASAGTGKTWNICALYMRLLLERNLTVQQILVVTFTNAATAELRERVRTRIRETLDHVRGQGPEHEDPLVRELVRACERAGLTPRAMEDRLDLALQSFDEAAIFTIHAFCQRALADAPFAAGMPFELELVPDDEQIVLEVAQDFWRRRVADRDCPAVLAAFLAKRKDSPEQFAKLLRKRLARPLARLRWPADLHTPVLLDTRELEAAYAAAKSTWQRSHAEVKAALAKALPTLHKSKYQETWLAHAYAEWDAHFALGDPIAPLDAKDSRLELCSAAELAAATYARYRDRPASLPPFCDQVERLFAAREALDVELERARLLLIHDLLRDGPNDVRERKRRTRVLAYDDLLFNLYQALHQRPDAAALVAALRARFPAALIDEFQDTDPVQFAIFRAIYGEGSAPVFLVGDPKQAIYSFRNADLYTYLDARGLATAEYTLEDNQRSSHDLVDAVNALFDANPEAFVLPGLSYHDVRVGGKKRKTLCDSSAPARADACVWMLPVADDGEPVRKQVASEMALRATAAEISRLLREAKAGRIRLDGRALQPGDIAVIVRSHAQGTRVREQLRALGLGSVELAQASVFASKDAEEVERLLLAVLEPSRADCVRSALATELLGLDAAAIDALATDESALVRHIAAFAAYRETWLREGIGVMYRKLLSEQGVTARMLARPDGERRLTNLLHLGERLHDAARLQPAPEALLRWLHAQRSEDQADDVAQLRLESDRNLVQIVTVHKAKGLEYPVVFCPFLWDGFALRSREWPGACSYHDPDGAAVLDFRDQAHQGEEAAPIRAAIERESLAETVRLLYVALTRASHRCYLIAGCYSRGTAWGKTSSSESTRSMLNWLVAGRGQTQAQWCKGNLDAAAIDAAWAALAARCHRKLTVEAMPIAPPQPCADDATPAEALRARTPPPSRERAWRISSYSALALDVGRETAAMDHDLHVAPVDEDLAPGELGSDDILAFPRGPLAGECLHAVLERSDFTDPGTWPAAIDRALAASPYRGPTGETQKLRDMIDRMLRDLTSTPLRPGLRLASVPLARRLTELEFSLPAAGVSAAALNAVLARHGYEVPRLAFPELQGYLKGFIDLVVEHDGRFYIVDWKSNHLGYTLATYSAGALDRAMVAHGYHLQHLLYTVALHRYLTRRMSRYRFEQHFGGVLYVFIRGVRPSWRMTNGEPAGVWFHRID
ncbi:MAG TPA: exodeoxyribonuclease V subunit beta, partial [Casimicrobiaceae bacterium]|nr:exodeoxyribonuclease V subunit beta [Casimicrobiaceae bacterium]